MRDLVGGDDVLFLGRDNFVSWELLGSEVYTPIRNPYDTEPVWSLYRATPINAKFDWDNVPPKLSSDRKALDDFDWVITTSADFNSQAPPEFKPVLETQDFVLWRARWRGRPRQAHVARADLPRLDRRTAPTSEKRGLARLDGSAVVFAGPPVIGKAWEPGPDITDAAGAVEELLLAPRRWAISIQYASTQDPRISAPGQEWTMRANLLFRGPSPYYPVGTLEVPGNEDAAAGLTRFEVRVDRPPLAGRLVGTESRAYLGRIVATPVTPRERVPLSAACGRYLDWYSPAPGSDLAGIEAPTPEEPDEG